MIQTKRILAEKAWENRDQLKQWYCRLSQEIPLPFYCSVDLRDSGIKVVPVDCNLYPAGFNNICEKDLRAASSIVKNQILQEMNGKEIKKILILPESHTGNSHYIENLYYLGEILREAGFEVQMGWYDCTDPSENRKIPLVSFTGKEMTAESICIRNGVLSAGGFTPEAILLNNDFSGGFPACLDEVEQPIFPSHLLGWHTRKKSDHFEKYNQLASEFAHTLDLDPWLLQVESASVDSVDFGQSEGMDRIAETVDQVLGRVSKKYQEYGVDQKPFVFVKSNRGTYGMGILVVRSPDELKNLNRRTKNKMSTGKNRLAIESVLVQEGVPTATEVNHLPAEPVVYLVGAELIGGFLRTNTLKSAEENLNSKGMVFKKLCMSDLQEMMLSEKSLDSLVERDQLLELVYGSVARLSALATGMEIKEHTT